MTYSLIRNIENKVVICICYEYVCQFSSYAFLHMNTPSFLGNKSKPLHFPFNAHLFENILTLILLCFSLAILVKDIDEGNQSLLYLSFTIVCDWKKEELIFHLPFLDNSGKKNLKLVDLENRSLFFNNLQILVNNDFYFDY